ncbi:tetratricopeptide repeat-containing sensor histidine kinase [Spirosoma endophyticum]|uniref:histidine kinase n=1 Tax=Spirosoma endophyticum TaxID=662367 RepID=A0A1I1IPF6_9BACT|nr:tetratricopeptide repeat protein [Spirosoma endophyticum]SFC35653.1 Two-component sensor histidine kinase, contains HisKA and HATPase domains [Spirosoma endophyticum]
MKIAIQFLLFSCVCICGQISYAQKANKERDSLLQILPKLPQDSVRFEALYTIGNSYKATNAYKARLYATQALQLAQQLHMDVAEADAYNLISATYRIESNYPLAKTYLLRAIPIWDQMKKPKGLSQGYNNLSNMLIEGEKNYDLALVYAKKALEINTKEGLTKYIPETYNQIGLVYKNKGNLEQARYYFLEAARLTEKGPADKQANLSMFFNNLSKVTLEQGQPKEALAWAQRATTINQRFDNQLSMTYSLENTARVYASLGNLKQAETLFAQALTLANQLKAPKRVLDIYKTMSDSYQQAGKTSQALAAYQRFHTLSDSVFTVERGHQLNELQIQYETTEKEQHINQLNRESELHQRQMIYLGSGSGLLLLLLGFSGWQYRRIQRSRTRISQQSDKLELLIKELHHRVKNNLALVSGLLNLQSYQPYNEQTLQVVRQRIEAMSLIHQRLYQTDLLTQVNIFDYLTDLTESLLRAYGFQPNELDLTIAIKVEWLDVDQAIPLGLIANEVITNALKYAYQKIDHTPSLHISLTNETALLFEVTDNGAGFDPAKWQKPNGSFGKQLIKALSAQLGGSYELDTGSTGTHFQLRMPKIA